MPFPLFGINLREIETASAIHLDPWQGSKGFYVRKYRAELEYVAKLLSNSSREVRVRFIPEFQVAELYVPDKYVVAHIAVHGSECAAYRAFVTPCALKKNEQAILEKKIPLKVIFFAPT